MEQTFVFNKTYQDRLQEFTNVLGNSKLSSVIDIKREWSLFLEFAMDSNGWQAIWKIPRLLCEELCIEYPTRALVYVKLIDVKELSASICLLSTQHHVELSNKCNVPLIQLSITKEQDLSVGLNLESTANCLDMLTFFYTHIMMPWDYDDEDTSDWLHKHLEPRLRLYFDIQQNFISKLKSRRLESLLNKARRLHAYRTQLESNIQENEDNIKIEKLLDIHVSMKLIRNEVEILSNPLFRNMILDSADESLNYKSDGGGVVWTVFQASDTFDDQLALLKLVGECTAPNSSIRIVSKASEAFHSANSGDTIIFNKGIYEINKTISLPNGVVIKALYPESETILTGKNDDILLDCYGSLVLENLTLDVKVAQCGIVVQSGSVTLKNCKIVGNEKISTHRGIVVICGSTLKVINCHISNFFTAIVGYRSSCITLQNCKVTECNTGLKIFAKVKLEAYGVVFCNCKEYGIWVETEELLDEGVFQQGSFCLLEMFTDIKLQDVTREDSGKDDVIIMHKIKLRAITDLFSDPELDPTIIHNEDLNDAI